MVVFFGEKAYTSRLVVRGGRGEEETMQTYDIQSLEECCLLLEGCRGVAQAPRWHPEGDVFQHSLQVTAWALRESDDLELILAAMLHDIGKIGGSAGHAERAAGELGGRLGEKSVWLIANHMRIWHLLLGEMRRVEKVRALVGHPWLPDLVLLARWDKMGRDPALQLPYSRAELVAALARCLRRERF